MRSESGEGGLRVREVEVFPGQALRRLTSLDREQYVRRTTTPNEMERILDDPRVVEGARRRMRRELTPERMPHRRTSLVDRPDTTPEVGRWLHEGRHAGGDRWLQKNREVPQTCTTLCTSSSAGNAGRS